MSAIVFSLVDDSHRIDTELTLREFSAIGYVTVQWALLEHQILSTTIEIADISGTALPVDATALSFKKRIRALRALAKTVMKKSKKQKKLPRASDKDQRDGKKSKSHHPRPLGLGHQESRKTFCIQLPRTVLFRRTI